MALRRTVHLLGCRLAVVGDHVRVTWWDRSPDGEKKSIYPDFASA